MVHSLAKLHLVGVPKAQDNAKYHDHLKLFKLKISWKGNGKGLGLIRVSGARELIYDDLSCEFSRDTEVALKFHKRSRQRKICSTLQPIRDTEFSIESGHRHYYSAKALKYYRINTLQQLAILTEPNYLYRMPKPSCMNILAWGVFPEYARKSLA